MAQTYTIDQIKARIIARGSKASKIEFLTKDCGMSEFDAENTYRLIMLVNSSSPRPVRRRAQRAIENLIHFTMGIELECTNVHRAAVRSICASKGIATHDDYNNYNHRDSNSSYKLMSDSSLRSSSGDTYSTCEIVTPILNNLDSLKVVCEVLNEAGAGVNSSCGFHVHFGAKDFTGAQWRRIIINYARLEDVIDSFMARSRRGNNSEWCASVKNAARELEGDEAGTFTKCARALRYNRYHKINLEAYSRHQTIEFRQHSGTTDFVKIEKWVNFLASLLTYSIRNTELIPSNVTSIDQIPFLNEENKNYFKGRANEFARREGRTLPYAI